ncbi:hypothetical protein CCACVL1_23170, partial [Corchorus capsularis]
AQLQIHFQGRNKNQGRHQFVFD